MLSDGNGITDSNLREQYSFRWAHYACCEEDI